jgi:hypothetical protein
MQQHRLIRRSFIFEIHNALVISGQHSGLAFFVNSQALLPNARTLFQNFALVATKLRQ